MNKWLSGAEILVEESRIRGGGALISSECGGLIKGWRAEECTLEAISDTVSEAAKRWRSSGYHRANLFPVH